MTRIVASGWTGLPTADPGTAGTCATRAAWRNGALLAVLALLAGSAACTAETPPRPPAPVPQAPVPSAPASPAPVAPAPVAPAPVPPATGVYATPALPPAVAVNQGGTPPAAGPPTHPKAAVPAALLDAMRADLQQRMAASALQIEVLEADEVVWPDGSMGCAQPGMHYTMALVPGYRVVLGVRGQRYAYHASKRGGFVYCKGAENVPPPPGGPFIQ